MARDTFLSNQKKGRLSWKVYPAIEVNLSILKVRENDHCQQFHNFGKKKCGNSSIKKGKEKEGEKKKRETLLIT